MILSCRRDQYGHLYQFRFYKLKKGLTRIPEHFIVWSIVDLIRVLDSSIKKEPIFRVRGVK